MGREKARKDDMAKAITMGMSAEQFEKKFGIEKPYYEARAEEAKATAKALGAFGGSGEKLGKFRKDIAEIAGPGQKPTRPQPAPNKLAPIIKFLSISFFEELEEYEKCAFLIKIQKFLESSLESES